MQTRCAFLVTGVFLILVAIAGPAAAEEPIQITFDGPVEMEEFLRAVSKATDLSLGYDPRSRVIEGAVIAGPLTLEGSAEEIFEAVRALLVPYELVVIPLGPEKNRRWMVLDARQTATILKLKAEPVEVTEENVDDLAHRDGFFVTTRIGIEHLPPAAMQQMRNAFSRIVTGQNIGHVTEVPDARALVVTDFAPIVASIWRLAKQMDVALPRITSGREPVFRAIGLKHARAEVLAELLAQHLVANAPPPWQGPPQARAGVAAQEPGLRIHADPRLNQLLVSGSADQVDRAGEIVGALDRPAPGRETGGPPQTWIAVIRLEHIQAQAAAQALLGLIGGAQAAWLAEAQGIRPSVMAHRETNSLLIQATSSALEKLRKVVTELDAAEGEKDPLLGEGAEIAERLRAAKIHLDFRHASLQAVVDGLSEKAGVPIHVTPRAVVHAANRGDEVTLAVEGLSAWTALRMILNSVPDLDWEVIGDGIVIKTREETLR